MSRIVCLLKSDRTFTVYILASIGFVIGTILFEALFATINVSVTGDPFTWKTFRDCPSCGGLSYCVDPQASWYHCGKCGREVVLRRKWGRLSGD